MNEDQIIEEQTRRTDAEVFYVPTRENPHIWSRPVVDYAFCFILEREADRLRVERDKYANELQQLCEIVMGGPTVARFASVKERLESIVAEVQAVLTRPNQNEV